MAQLAPGGRRTVTALAVTLVCVLLASLARLVLSGPSSPATDLDIALYGTTSACAGALLVARGILVPVERGTWFCFAAMPLLAIVAGLVWGASDSDLGLSPSDLFWGLGYVAALVGSALYLRHRIGDAYRSFWFDAIGVALCLCAIGIALLGPMMRHHAGLTGSPIALNVVYPASDAAIWSTVLAAGAMAGRRLQRQDALLAFTFIVFCAVDGSYALGLAGIVPEGVRFTGFGQCLGWTVLAAAAWARPSAAGSLKVGGWWETFPTVCWMIAGGGVLLAGTITHVEAVAIGFAVAAILASAIRATLVTRDVRTLVVHRRQALTDELTGLPNRRALLQRLELLTRDRGRGKERASLLLADLDGFKELNDALGHGAGDELLAAVARRLERVEGAWAVRLGGDEFAALVHEPHDPRVVAAEILAALAEPVALADVTVGIAASIGIARFPLDATTTDELLRRADVAMYDAKRRRVGVATYAAERDGYSRARVTLASDLQRAVEDPAAAGLWLAFQPQVDMVSRRVTGIEALIRWNHAAQGAISPAELLPLAERTGMLSRLTDWVVEEAITTAAAWHAAGHGARLAVNVSAVTLIDASLPARVAASLDRHALDPRALVVEVTEDAVMSDPQRCCEVLAELAAMGVGISVDDFGTGQSSLAQLRRIGADELKIDRSFILGMTHDRFDREVVVAVAGMGRRLGMRLVAEGVEDVSTWDALVDVGCDVAQGFGIARPMGRDKLLTLLAEPAPLGAVLRAA
ncbi:MAG: bifunctional diguanylate cyclase/phosphodiesterase [Solirubrobacterales bacterium]|nr:bifunctional diguanylate cyclase/phosphodiesterase [Solirubrobacterales bacterium]